MSQYTSLISEVEGAFASQEWLENSIAVYPINFNDPNRPNEFVIVEVLPSKPLMSEFGGSLQVAGLIIVQIYVPANSGSRRLYEISDLLDKIMQKKVINVNIQTESSTLDVKGVDSDDPGLFRGDYSVRFNSY